MTAAASADSAERPGAIPAVSRVAWVDIAKGWCIVLVVTMHSALGVGLALGETGWLHAVVAFAKPFRMPDFFVIAGLFVGRAIDLPWRAYLDRKAVHFAYFYALWLAIILAAKSFELGIAAPGPFIRAYLWGFVDPFSTMWFIQLLPLLFIAARLLRDVPTWISLGTALLLHLSAASVPTGGAYAMSSAWTGLATIDNFALFFIYFLIGVKARDAIFRLVRIAADRPLAAVICLAAWAVSDALAVRFDMAGIPGLTLIFGLSGAGAVVAVSALLARFSLLGWLAYCGRHSLVIYLAFVLPMGAARLALLKVGLITSVGWNSLIVAAVAIAVPLALHHVTKQTPLAFLFTRPAWARLPGSGQEAQTQKEMRANEA